MNKWELTCGKFDCSKIEIQEDKPDTVIEHKGYDLWIEGYSVTGHSMEDSLIASYDVETYDEAIAEYRKENPDVKIGICSLTGLHTIWACRIYHNKGDIKKLLLNEGIHSTLRKSKKDAK